MTDAFQSTPKEHKNIKRRVYDALNVIIAANILTKNGKIIKKNQYHENLLKEAKH